MRIEAASTRTGLAGCLLATAAILALAASNAAPAAAGSEARGLPECDGKTATIYQPNEFGQYVGTTQDDVIVASALDDTIDGRQGRDTICGLEGNDTIFGYDGGDKVLAGAGHDAIYGEGGGDNLRGQDGDDFFVGGAGRDVCRGGEGTDTLGVMASCETKRGIENR